MKIIQNISGLILFFTILTSLAHSALSEIPKEANAAKIWADIRLKDINEFEEKPKPELFAGIGEMLRQLTTLNYRDCAEKYYIINRIQTSLMAIPGHAQFFGDRIHTAYEPLNNPLFPALRSSPSAVQEPPAKSKFLAVSLAVWKYFLTRNVRFQSLSMHESRERP